LINYGRAFRDRFWKTLYPHNDHDPVGTHGLWSQFRNNSLQIVQWIARNVLCVPLCAAARVKSQRARAVVLFTPKAESAADAFLIKNALALLLIPPAFHKRRKQNQPTRFLALRASELLHSRLAQKQHTRDDAMIARRESRPTGAARAETSLPRPDVRGGSVYSLIIQL
jgi:hypothetical protein